MLKTKTRKRFLALFLCAVMVIFGVNVQVLGAKAETVTYNNVSGYKIFINNDLIQVYLNNAKVTSIGGKSVEDLGITYDATNHKLTLNNVKLMSTSTNDFFVVSGDSLTVELIGENIIQTGGKFVTAEFSNREQTLAFTGDGTLKINGGKGISSNGNLSVTGVTIIASEVSSLFSANKNLEISDATVNVESVEPGDIMCAKEDIILDQATLDITCNSNAMKAGDTTSGSMTIKDSTLELYSSNGNDICVNENLTVDNSKLTVSSMYQPCITVKNNTTIKNKSVVKTKSSREKVIKSEKNISVDDSTVDILSREVAILCTEMEILNGAQVNVTSKENSAIFYVKKLSVTDASLTAIGTTASLNSMGDFVAKNATINVQATEQKENGSAIIGNNVTLDTSNTTVTSSGTGAKGIHVSYNVTIIDGTTSIAVSGSETKGIVCNSMTLDKGLTTITSSGQAISCETDITANADAFDFFGGNDSSSAVQITKDELTQCKYVKTVGKEPVGPTDPPGPTNPTDPTDPTNPDKIGWIQDGDNTYYYDDQGQRVTAWLTLEGKTYYFDADGVLCTGWMKIGSKWYYFEASGTMATGWKQIGSKWYYFATSGAMATGWKQIGNKWYYFETSGAMATGTQTIGGKTYKFDSNGVLK